MAKKKAKNEEVKVEEKAVETPVEEKTEVIPTEAPKEEQPVEKKEKKKVNKLVIALIAVIVLLLAVIVGLLVHQFVGKKEAKEEQNTEEVAQKDEGLYPPKDAEIVDYNAMNNGGGGGLNLHCMISGTFDYADKKALEPGDVFECLYGVEVINGFKVETLYFDIEYGSGLEYLGTTQVVNEKHTKIEGDRTKTTFDQPDSVVDSYYAYKFEVKENATTEDLYLKVKNIVFKTPTKKYYSLAEQEVKFSIKSQKYYIYRYNNDNDAINVYDQKIDNEYQTYVGEYICKTKNCEYAYSSTKNYVLFKDSSYLAYNYKTGETTDLSQFDSYEDLELVGDKELYGVIMHQDGETYYKTGYYSIKKNKYIIPMTKNLLMFVNKNYIYVDEEESGKFIDFNGVEFVPSASDMERIEGTDFYYLTGFAGMDAITYYFYNKDGKKLFKGEGYTESFSSIVAASKAGNLLLNKGSKFYEYDIDEKVVYESSSYEALEFADEYIIVLDKDNTLRIIDERENEIANFGKLPKDAYVHWALSGSWDDNGKEGVYIVVETDSVTKEELKEQDDYETEEDFTEMYEYESRGYEYYYIPETGETGKFATFIGGYAKPILYLYPTQDNTKVKVTFEKPWLLSTTYPKYNREWKVIADKNGDLHDMSGKYYYGLYWEEDGSTEVDFSEGFYVTKDNAIEFLEEKLTLIGLNDRERNEFIMYWLPILEKNEKNLVYFELTEDREAYNKLNISPKPDSLLRVAIHVKKVDRRTKIKEQKLTPFERKGFTAVEWGGVIH